MVATKLWRAKTKRVAKVHTWRARRSRCGELVQWDTSEHDWLEGRGPKLYLISMIDDTHRPLGKEHHLAASLRHVETRQVANDYTSRFDNQLYQIQRIDIRAGLRGGTVRVENACMARWQCGSGIAISPSALVRRGPKWPWQTSPAPLWQNGAAQEPLEKNFHIGRHDLAKKTSLR
jgi:hypothetical protein